MLGHPCGHHFHFGTNQKQLIVNVFDIGIRRQEIPTKLGDCKGNLVFCLSAKELDDQIQLFNIYSCKRNTKDDSEDEE